VGKAISLRDRVSSYFQKTVNLGPKTTALVSKISKIEHINVGSELEALLLEAELIKRFRPPYNISLKDDKQYSYIIVRKQKVESGKPRIKPEIYCVGTARKIEDKGKKTLYFGPFPDGTTVRQVLRRLRHIFKFCDCSQSKLQRYSKLRRPCIFGNIDLCWAPCDEGVSLEDYNSNMRRLIKFLHSGKKDPIIKDLRHQMVRLSKAKRFEEAAHLRDQIDNFEYVTQNFRPAVEFLKNPNLIEDERSEAVKELVELLSLTPSGGDIRIECFDISHLGGQQMVGSMVVFVNGAPVKSEYRRFKIKAVKGINDVAALAEVVTRRFSNDWPRPQVLVVDGGKPQVAAAKAVIASNGLTESIVLIGLAKRLEEIVRSDGTVVRLPKASKSLRLLQSLRDEAHRFANAYRKKLKSDFKI